MIYRAEVARERSGRELIGGRPRVGPDEMITPGWRSDLERPRFAAEASWEAAGRARRVLRGAMRVKAEVSADREALVMTGSCGLFAPRSLLAGGDPGVKCDAAAIRG